MSIDIVFPAHNEQHRIGPTLHAYRAGFDRPDVTFHVALDHCTDATAEVVAAHMRADRRVRAHRYPRLGKGGVLIETFRRTRGDVVAFVDADCATPPRELAALIAGLGTADVAIACRWHPASVLPARRTLARRLSSAWFSAGVKALFGLPVDDTQCGAKALRRSFAQAALPLLSSRDLVFDVDLLLAARALHARVKELPTVWIDRDGSSVRPLHDGSRMAASLLRLWLHQKVMPTPVAEPASTIDLTAVEEPADVAA